MWSWVSSYECIVDEEQNCGPLLVPEGPAQAGLADKDVFKELRVVGYRVGRNDYVLKIATLHGTPYFYYLTF